MRAFACLLAFATLACAQSAPPPIPTLSQHRVEFLRALQDWDLADSNLERDALRLAPAEILPRIDSVEARRSRLDQARSRYLETLRTALQVQLSILRSSDPISLDDLKSIQQHQIDDATATASFLNSQVRRLKLSERQRGEELQMNRNRLAAIQGAILSHQAALAADPASLPRARAHAAADALNLDLTATVSDPTDWPKTYAALRNDVRSRPAPAAPAATAAPAPVQLVLPTLAGAWGYSNPNATRNGDIYQWLSARADITQNGDLVEGTYECTYAVPPGEKYNPTVRFSFSGRVASEVMRFELKPPLKGWLRILRPAAAELTIAYYISNAKQNGISFGEIAEDDPQVLSRLSK